MNTEERNPRVIDITLSINYNISPDEDIKEIHQAIHDDDNYKINETYIGYDVNQYQPIRVIYGDNINYIKYRVDTRKRDKYHETSIKIQSDDATYLSQNGFKLIHKIKSKSIQILLQKNMIYAPVIYRDVLIAAIFTYRVPINKATELNHIINILHTKIISNIATLRLLGEKGNIKLLPQIFTELPYEYELYGLYINTRTPTIKALPSLKEVSEFIYHNNQHLGATGMAWMVSRDLKRGTFNSKRIIIKTAAKIQHMQDNEKYKWLTNWRHPNNTPFMFELKLTKKYKPQKDLPQFNKMIKDKVIEHFAWQKKEHLIWISIIKQLAHEMEQQHKTSIYKYQIQNAIQEKYKKWNMEDLNELIYYATNTGEWNIENECITITKLRDQKQNHEKSQHKSPMAIVDDNNDTDENKN